MPDVPNPTELFTAELQELRVELEKLKLSQLRKRVVAAGVSDEQLDEAEDAETPKTALITLMLEREEAKMVEQSAPVVDTKETVPDVAVPDVAVPDVSELDNSTDAWYCDESGDKHLFTYTERSGASVSGYVKYDEGDKGGSSDRIEFSFHEQNSHEDTGIVAMSLEWYEVNWKGMSNTQRIEEITNSKYSSVDIDDESYNGSDSDDD